MDRQAEFGSLTSALADATAFGSEDVLVAHGDSLELLRRLPSASVSLILTDPPYHSTKKENITGDRDFAEDEHFIDWMMAYAAEWKRVLKLSGTVYVFCASMMSARLEVAISQHLRPINHVVWTKPNEPGYDGWKGKTRKESLRRWYPHSERILVFEQGGYGTFEAYRRSPQGEYLLAARKSSGLSTIELTEQIGAYGRVNRGGAVANWEAGRNVPSREQYAKLVEALESAGVAQQMLPYEDVFRPMFVSNEVEFTDVWEFMSVRPFAGKHPAEKPQDMLAHIIAASSYEGDVVLDTFAGSGSTALAAKQLRRRSITMEVERQWVDRTIMDLQALELLGPEELAIPRRARTMKRSTPVLDRLFD